MRECGTCSACCRWPEIPALGKAQGVTCSRLELCGYGCTEYAERPTMCRDYRCAWIEGHGRPEDQPDIAGVLIDVRDSQFGDVLIARDLGRGTPRKQRRAIDRISKDTGMPCLLVSNDDPERVAFVRGPAEIVAYLVKAYPQLEALV